MTTKQEKPIATLDMEITLAGDDVVNRDSVDNDGQLGKRPMRDQAGNQLKNYTPSKKHYQTTVVDGKLKVDIENPLLKISSHCLTQNAFRDYSRIAHEGPLINNAAGKDLLKNSYYATIANILKGYVDASKSQIIKRKAPLMVTSARQVSGDALKREVAVNSGFQGSTSYFYRDTIGEYRAKFKVSLDLEEGAFIVGDQTFNRQAFNTSPEALDVFLKQLNTTFGEEHEVKKYVKKGDGGAKLISEEGVLLSHNAMKELCKKVVELYSNINITKSDAYCVTDSVKLYATPKGGRRWDDANQITLEEIDGLDISRGYEEASAETLAGSVLLDAMKAGEEKKKAKDEKKKASAVKKAGKKDEKAPKAATKAVKKSKK